MNDRPAEPDEDPFVRRDDDEGEAPAPPDSLGWTTEDIPNQIGRTFVVTGSNSGLGFQTVRALAGRGARVIMAVRSEKKGTAAAEAVHAEHPDAPLELHYVDLSDLDSVRAFAAAVDRVDVLINNAGVMMPPHKLTKQGAELQFGVNHLGHYLLTGLLLEKLLMGSDPRVVTVTCEVHKRGRIHFDDLDGRHNYARSKFYAQSKLANVVFGIELNRRLRANGLAMRSVLAHPGVAATGIRSTGPTGLVKVALQVPARLKARDAATAALPQLFAATAAEADSGQYIGPSTRKENRGSPVPAEPLDAARDRELAKRLWDRSDELTGTRFPLTY